MNHRDHHHKHTALMLLACAFAFVYLLARQFQGQDMMRRRDSRGGSTADEVAPLPAKLEKIKENTSKPTIQTGAAASSGEARGIKNPPSQSISSPPLSGGEGSGVRSISFTSLNAIPQSFMRLGIITTAGIMMDTQRVIVTTNTNTIKRKGDSKTLTNDEIKQVGLTVDSLTFYNDPSWANILVLVEVVRNQQSLLIQAPYSVRRDDKAHLNALITQLTQK